MGLLSRFGPQGGGGRGVVGAGRGVGSMLVCAGLLLTGCTNASEGTATSTGTIAATAAPVTATSAGAVDLRRPLALPVLGAGQACPVTLARHQPDPGLGIVQGVGVAGPVGLAADGSLAYVAPDVRTVWTDRSWGGQKVLWAVDGTVQGPVLVRGRQLDGSHLGGFDDPVRSELVLQPGQEAGSGLWRDYPSYTRLRAPGCYGFQVDAATGTTVIVFRAVGPVVSG